MSENCSNNVQTPGTSNPLNSAISPNDHGSSTSTSGDCIIEDVTCDASVYIGAAVRMDSSSNEAVNAIASAPSTSKAIGICIAKPTATTCNIQICGLTPEVFSGLTVDNEYFLSATTSGGVTNDAPSGVNNYVVSPLGEAFSPTRLIIHIKSRLIRSV